jgi:hypothetical protein
MVKGLGSQFAPAYAGIALFEYMVLEAAQKATRVFPSGSMLRLGDEALPLEVRVTALAHEPEEYLR